MTHPQVSLFTCVIVAAAHVSTAPDDGRLPPPGLAASVLLLGGVGLGAVACGMPLWILPAPLLAASGLLMYLESGLLRDYCLLVAASLAGGGCDWLLVCGCD